MMGSNLLWFLFGTTIASCHVLRNPAGQIGLAHVPLTYSPPSGLSQIMTHLLPGGGNIIYKPQFIIPPGLQTLIDCEKDGSVQFVPRPEVIVQRPLHPEAVAVVVPEEVIEQKPIEIPVPPVLPPFTMPEIPVFDEEPKVWVPETEYIQQVQPVIPEENFTPIEIPTPPELPPFVMPALPEVIVETRPDIPAVPCEKIPVPPRLPELPAPIEIAPEPEYIPIEIPEPPILPPFVMPEIPEIIVEAGQPENRQEIPLPAPVEIILEPEFVPVDIPAPPELPPFVMPALPEIIFETRPEINEIPCEKIPQPPRLPELPAPVEPEFIPVEIPEPPILPPFVMPPLPEIIVDNPEINEIPVEPCEKDNKIPQLPEPLAPVEIIPEPQFIEIPAPPELPPFVMPAIPEVIVEKAERFEEPPPEVLPYIPEAPILPPMTLPVHPEPIVIEPVMPEIKKDCDEHPQLPPIQIPAAPVLPAFIMPELHAIPISNPVTFDIPSTPEIIPYEYVHEVPTILKEILPAPVLPPLEIRTPIVEPEPCDHNERPANQPILILEQVHPTTGVSVQEMVPEVMELNVAGKRVAIPSLSSLSFPNFCVQNIIIDRALPSMIMGQRDYAGGLATYSAGEYPVLPMFQYYKR